MYGLITLIHDTMHLSNISLDRGKVREVTICVENPQILLRGAYFGQWHLIHGRQYQCFLMWFYCRNFSTEELTRVISGFRCEVYESPTLLGYYVASSGNSLPTLRDNPLVQSSRAHWRWDRDRQVKIEYGADRLSRNVGTELPLPAVFKPEKRS
jgi:hypothetical protein